MNRLWIAVLAAAVVVVVLAEASLFTVAQTEQVLITQFGQPIRVISTPGLHAKVPFAQSAISFDRRLLDFEVPGDEVILGDQRRLIVDSFIRYRIADPLRYYKAFGPSDEAIGGRLNAVVSSSLRRVLGTEPLLAVLSSDRDRIMGTIRGEVNAEMQSFGVTVQDMRIRRADLPEENTLAILKRMQSERERVARQARAEGAEASARIRADAERDRTILLAEARGTSERLRGEGEQQAIATYARAFQKDPQFFATWRTLQAYRDAFSAGSTRLLLTSDNDFLRYLQRLPEPSPQAPQH